MRTSSPALLPRPRHLEVVGDGPPVAALELSVVQATELPPEGFELEVSAAGARLRHRDANGERYGRAALDQLVAQADERLPAVRLRDWPDLAVRGYMLDISRDRVPTRETLARLVEVLFLCRINHLQLYTEHTFAYRQHRAVWEGASPLTPDDVRWLDQLCVGRGIELAANQNCFGHMERWLSHDAYRTRAECPDGYELLPGIAMPPATLAPTPDNAAFVLGLLDELLPNFTSRRVNIGCDETFELGKCASAAEMARVGKGAVYVEHLRRIVEPLVDAGHQVQFWGDVVRRRPELLGALPADVTALAWTYEGSGPENERPEVPGPLQNVLHELGIDLTAPTGFAHAVAPFADAGFPFWVAPGTSSWNSLVGRIDNAVANLLDAVEVALSTGAEGVLITDWGDNGHLQPPAVSIPPLVYGAAVAWCLEANRDLDLAAAVDQWVFGDTAAVLGRALDRLGRLWRRSGQRAFNGSPFQAALCRHQRQFVTGEPDAGAVADVLDEVEDILASLRRARPQCADGAIVVREVEHASRLLRHGAWLLSARAGGAAPTAVELREDLSASIEEHRACWSDRSRPGGLADSVAHLERARASYED